MANPFAQFFATSPVVRGRDVVRELPGAAMQAASQFIEHGIQAPVALERPEGSKIPSLRFKEPTKDIKTALIKGQQNRVRDVYKQTVEPLSIVSEKMVRGEAITDEEVSQAGLSVVGFMAPENEAGKVAAQSLRNNRVFQQASKNLEQHIISPTKAKGAGLYSRGKDLVADIKEKLVDSFSPIADSIRDGELTIAGSKVTLDTLKDPRMLRNRVLGIPSIAENMLEQRLSPILQRVGSKNTNSFNKYLASRHIVDRFEKGLLTPEQLPKGLSIDDAKTYVDATASVFDEAAQEVSAYTQRLLKYAQEGGMVSKELYDDLVKKYPNYVPLNRVLDEMDGFGTNSTASVNYQTVVKTLRGSEKEIVNPLESIVNKTLETVEQVEKNRVAQSIASLRHFDQFKDLIKKTQAPQVPVANIEHTSIVFPEVMDEVTRIVQAYGGSIERNIKIGGAGRAGYFSTPVGVQGTAEGTNLVTKFGTPKDVLLHEFGHLLDTKFGLKSGEFFDKAVNVELRNVADLRGGVKGEFGTPGYKAYTRKGQEKIAEFIGMFFADNKNAEAVAPITTKKFTEFLQDKPELQKLASIMRSRMIGVETAKETIFRPSAFGPTVPHISVFEDGKRAFYEVPKEFEEAAKNLNVDVADIFTKTVGQVNRLARLGYTGANLPFALTNIIRDQFTASIVAGYKGTMLNPYDFTAAFMSTLRRGKDFQNFMASGGGYSNFFSQGRTQTASSVKHLASTPAQRIKNVITNPKEWLTTLEDLIGISETTTRVQQFRINSRELNGQFLDPFVAPTAKGLEALKAGRETTVDFAKKGGYGRVLNSLYLYLNAGIQGTRLTVNTVKAHPAKTAFRLGAYVYTPTALATMWNLATPERRAAYADIPAWEKNSNIIILPPNPQKDKEGIYMNAYKIPLPQSFSSLVIPVRAAIEHLAGGNPDSMPEVLWDSFNEISPLKLNTSSLSTTVASPFIENATNTDLFTKGKIVPRNQENLPPGEQESFDTSGLIKLVGKKLDMSPPKIQNVITAYSGGVGNQALNAVDRGLAAVGIIEPEDIGGRGIIEDIQRRFLKVRGGAEQDKTFKQAEELEAERAKRVKQNKGAAEEIYNQLQTLPNEQWLPKMQELKSLGVLDAEIYKEIQKQAQEEKLGLTPAEKKIRSLPIKERAIWINDRLKSMPSAERTTLLKELKTKKILTEKTYEEVLSLRKRPLDN